jgi:hypothetical protein
MAYSFEYLYESAKNLEFSFENNYDNDFPKFLESLNELCGISIGFIETCDFQDKVFKMAIISKKILQSENIYDSIVINKKTFEHLIILTKMSIKKMIFDKNLEIIKKENNDYGNDFMSDIKPSKKFRMSFDSHSENDESKESECMSAANQSESEYQSESENQSECDYSSNASISAVSESISSSSSTTNANEYLSDTLESLHLNENENELKKTSYESLFESEIMKYPSNFENEMCFDF